MLSAPDAHVCATRAPFPCRPTIESVLASLASMRMALGGSTPPLQAVPAAALEGAAGGPRYVPGADLAAGLRGGGRGGGGPSSSAGFRLAAQEVSRSRELGMRCTAVVAPLAMRCMRRLRSWARTHADQRPAVPPPQPWSGISAQQGAPGGDRTGLPPRTPPASALPVSPHIEAFSLAGSFRKRLAKRRAGASPQAAAAAAAAAVAAPPTGDAPEAAAATSALAACPTGGAPEAAAAAAPVAAPPDGGAPQAAVAAIAFAAPPTDRAPEAAATAAAVAAPPIGDAPEGAAAAAGGAGASADPAPTRTPEARGAQPG